MDREILEKTVHIFHPSIILFDFINVVLILLLTWFALYFCSCRKVLRSTLHLHNPCPPRTVPGHDMLCPTKWNTWTLTCLAHLGPLYRFDLHIPYNYSCWPSLIICQITFWVCLSVCVITLQNNNKRMNLTFSTLKQGLCWWWGREDVNICLQFVYLNVDIIVSPRMSGDTMV